MSRYLSHLEARVLGVLIEKEFLTPAKYPLTLTGITFGCTQRTNRKPVMHNITEKEVIDALQSLAQFDLVIETQSKFTIRYAQNVTKILKIPSSALSLLGILLLRGPCTAAELRTFTEKTHKFNTTGALEGVLLELHKRGEESLQKQLIAKIPRKNGQKEGRWVQLLTGPVEGSKRPTTTRDDLIAEVLTLRTRLEFIEEKLGIYVESDIEDADSESIQQ